jgi:hypothetical protein
MNVVLVVIALTFCCSALLALGWLGERSEAFGRFCDAVCPPDGHRGRL